MPVDYVSPVRQAARAPAGGGDGFRLTGRHVLFGLLAFFLVVASVNGVMMTMALKTMSGLDARNGYDPSQRYNLDIAEARAQAARGWQVEVKLGALRVLSDGARQGSDAAVSFSDRDGQAIAGLVVNVRLAHPGDRRRDVVTSLEEVAPGRYVGPAAGLSPGQWDVVIEARDASGAKVFHSRQRAILKS
jgi:nitrogen fixation protein FixH